jgi:hypothetical protein
MDFKSVQTHYIIGIGRSGTSLLMSLLGAHPNLHATPENYFSIFFSQAFQNKTVFSAQDIHLIHRFNLAFGKLQPYVAFNYVLNEDSELLKNGFKGTYRELCNVIYLSFQHTTLQNEAVSAIIDKNPSNTLFIDRLLQINPQAKFILMVRDYRANMLSRKESIHLFTPDIAFNSFRWNYFTKKALQLKAKYPEKVLLVRYEDMVHETDASLSTIFTFLGVESINSENLRARERASYLDFEQDEKLKSSDRIQKKYGDLAKPIFTNRTDKWKESLSQAEIQVSESICGKTGAAVGYQTTQEISTFKLLSFKFKNIFKSLKVNLIFQKDYLFFYFPIEIKLKRFEKFVAKIDVKRSAVSK